MILRTAGPGPAYHPHSPAGQSRSKLSPQAMAAIVMSLVFHAIVAAYLYAHHFTVMALPAPPPSEPPLVIETVHFPPTQPPPIPHEKQQPVHRRAETPIRLHDTPLLVAPDAGPTIQAPPGPPAGGGQGVTEVLTTPVPPVAPPKPKVILNPDWISKPSGAQLADAYPGRALDVGVAGSVTLLCTVGVDGRVRDCNVAQETPRNFGFGQAALRLSRWFKIRPETENGQAVDGALVRVPLQFGVG